MSEFAAPIVPQFQGGRLVAMASHGSDAGLHVDFFVDDEYQQFESEKQGRAIYKPVNKVRISAPGAKTDIIKNVQMEDIGNVPSHPRRFPGQWAAFVAQQAQVPDGTPLEMCKFIASHRVKELKAMNIHTAEQLAAMSDAILQTIGMDGRRLRDLSQAYISEDTKVEKLSAALSENKSLQTDLEMMKKQLETLNQQMLSRHQSGQFPEPEPVREKRKYTRRASTQEEATP